MRISVITIIWFLVSFVTSAFFAFKAYCDPMRFVPFTDLLATVISILIGVALAISAILSNRPILSDKHYKTGDEKTRIESLIKRDYSILHTRIFFFFWIYYIALILAIFLKFLNIYEGQEVIDKANFSILFKITSASFALISSFALLCSAVLPSLLRKITIQRFDLE